MEIHPAVHGGAEQGSARVGRGQGMSLSKNVFQELLDEARAKENIFTHIDSAAIL